MTEHRHEKDSAEVASEAGFTGTLSDLIVWLSESLVYGVVSISELTNKAASGKIVVEIATCTGGYSSDEHLLGRLQHSIYMQQHWHSSERGGLVTYRVSPETWISEEEVPWLKPEADEPFEIVARARHVIVQNDISAGFYDNFPNGVELVFTEPDRDVGNLDGTLIVRGWSGKV